jgi:chromosome segregation ATPase
MGVGGVAARLARLVTGTPSPLGVVDVNRVSLNGGGNTPTSLKRKVGAPDSVSKNTTTTTTTTPNPNSEGEPTTSNEATTTKPVPPLVPAPSISPLRLSLRDDEAATADAHAHMLALREELKAAHALAEERAEELRHLWAEAEALDAELAAKQKQEETNGDHHQNATGPSAALAAALAASEAHLEEAVQARAAAAQAADVAADLQRAISVTTAQATALDAEVASLRQEMAGARAELERLESARAAWEAQCEDERDVVCRLETELESKNVEMESIQASVREARQRVEQEHRARTDAEQVCRDLQDDIERLQAERDISEAERTCAVESLDEVRAQLDEKVDEVATMRQEVDERQATIARLESLVGQIESERDAMEAESRGKDAQADALRADMENLRSELVDKKMQTERGASQIAERLQRLEQEAEGLRHAVRDRERERDAAVSRGDELEASLTRAQVQILELTETTHTLSLRVEQEEERVADLQNKYAAAEAERETLEATLLEERAESTAALARLRAEHERLRGESESQRMAYQDSQEQNKETKRVHEEHVCQLETELERVQHDMKQAQDQVVALKTAAEGQEVDMETLQRELMGLTKKHADLSRQLVVAQEECARWQRIAEDRNTEKETLNSEKKALQSEKETLVAEKESLVRHYAEQESLWEQERDVIGETRREDQERFDRIAAQQAESDQKLVELESALAVSDAARLALAADLEDRRRHTQELQETLHQRSSTSTSTTTTSTELTMDKLDQRSNDHEDLRRQLREQLDVVATLREALVAAEADTQALADARAEIQASHVRSQELKQRVEALEQERASVALTPMTDEERDRLRRSRSRVSGVGVGVGSGDRSLPALVACGSPGDGSDGSGRGRGDESTGGLSSSLRAMPLSDLSTEYPTGETRRSLTPTALESYRQTQAARLAAVAMEAEMEGRISAARTALNEARALRLKLREVERGMIKKNARGRPPTGSPGSSVQSGESREAEAKAEAEAEALLRASAASLSELRESTMSFTDLRASTQHVKSWWPFGVRRK